MTTTPAPAASNRSTLTTAELTMLARQIASDGTKAHHDMLSRMADQAEVAEVLPGAVAVLRDANASEPTRARAFLALVRQWDIVAAANRPTFDQAFNALAAQWVAHQELRGHGDVAQLAESAVRVDALRDQMRSAAAVR